MPMILRLCKLSRWSRMCFTLIASNNLLTLLKATTPPVESDHEMGKSGLAGRDY